MLAVSAAWASAVGTILAAAVALFLAHNSSRVKLRVSIAEAEAPAAYPSRAIAFNVTNLGERPVTIVRLRWRAGRGPNSREEDAWVHLHMSGDETPKTLVYGESATFYVYQQEPGIPWLSNFLTDLLLENSVSTLRGCVYTSVAHVQTVVPDPDFLRQLQTSRA